MESGSNKKEIKTFIKNFIKKHITLIATMSAVTGLILAISIFLVNIKTQTTPYSKIIIKENSAIQTYNIKKNTKELHYSGKAIKNTEKSFKRKEIFFNIYPRFGLWVFIFSCLVAASFGFTPVIIFKIYKQSKQQINILIKNIIIASVFILIAWFVSSFRFFKFFFDKKKMWLELSDVFKSFDIFLNNPQLILGVMVLFCLIAPLTAIIGILNVDSNVAILVFNKKKENKEVKNDKKRKQAENKIIKNEISDIEEQYYKLKDSLKFYLEITAIMISATTVCTWVVRSAINKALPVIENINFIYPAEFVYIYGMSFTFFLAVIYIPIYNRLKEKGKILLRSISAEVDAELVEEMELDQSLILTKSSFQNFTTALSILGPGIASILGGVLEVAV